MKIWEIEDNREFESTNKHDTSIYILKNRLLYFKIDNEDYTLWGSSYNRLVNTDFEYLPEKEYYLVMKPEMKYQSEFDILNWDIGEKAFYFSNEYQNEAIKTQFTDYEIERMVPKLYLDICNKEEVGEYNDNSR